MYVEADFVLALVKEDDWLADSAERVYREHEDELWTSEYTLVELMMVAYREEWDVAHTIANVNALVDVRGDAESILAAANYVDDEGLTPFDALHLVRSQDAPIVSSDSSYDGLSERLALEDLE